MKEAQRGVLFGQKGGVVKSDGFFKTTNFRSSISVPLESISGPDWPFHQWFCIAIAQSRGIGCAWHTIVREDSETWSFPLKGMPSRSSSLYIKSGKWPWLSPSFSRSTSMRSSIDSHKLLIGVSLGNAK